MNDEKPSQPRIYTEDDLMRALREVADIAYDSDEPEVEYYRGRWDARQEILAHIAAVRARWKAREAYYNTVHQWHNVNDYVDHMWRQYLEFTS